MQYSLVAASLLTLAAAAPIVERAAPAYKMYRGDGSIGAGWPAITSWASFDAAWANAQPTLASSCTQFKTANNSPAEIANMRAAIAAVSRSSAVDERFILAIMMQESKGCVRAPTTNYGVRNPGLMQDHNGAHTCNEGGVKNPCPADQITGMIADGAAGTPAGPGLKQLVVGNTAQAYYQAARKFNSGSIAAGGDLGAGIATHCYASDVANRLMGWVTGPTACTLG